MPKEIRIGQAVGIENDNVNDCKVIVEARRNQILKHVGVGLEIKAILPPTTAGCPPPQSPQDADDPRDVVRLRESPGRIAQPNL
ncbi:hypothetical protein [Rhizobium herbae]|uniref:Uncharacterized protein n=1 Tax=Rhizobium herbae TaxID=508661 RepID=A0ABS4EHW8_9HYPH|nr:hypothetical protein [Rhizobium herbae]MBP1857539.1 hypothetical protein [Rhizobium herbae]